MKKTIIRCGWVVSLDDTIGDVTGADILIGDDKILAIGTDLGEADEVIDASEMIAIPGMVDAHLHTWETGLKAIGCDWRKGEYLRDVFAGMSVYFTPEDNYIATLAGSLSRLDAGVTTLLDYCHNIRSTDQAERSVDGLEDSGIRSVYVLGTGVLRPEEEKDTPLDQRTHPRERVKQIRDRLSSDEKLVTMALAIPGPHWAKEPAIRANIALARDFGLRTTSHATKRKHEELMKDGYSILIKEGILGPDHNIVHGNYLSDEELREIVEAGITVTSSVQSEVRGYGRPPAVNRVINFGGLPSLGVDVEPKIPGDMFREMQLALAYVLNERVREDLVKPETPIENKPVTTRDALKWATIGGAEALGLGHRIGTLTPGKQADIVLLRANDLNLFPVRNPLFSAVEFAHAGNVDTVLVAGEVRKRGGVLAYGDDKLRSVRTRLVESSDRIMRDAGYTVAS
ncbi:amidohydrolase family protein [Sulfitobacter sp. F26204]|uniref:amidohydrolase family protein n=1 Tax=Sulfitobacter sp. F26204 TaxID=2996014 RepID=UPI00225DF4D4|nr:amidohydrolase family protein [Sulfitobacter sp. F26204]MCX7560996.1 amidohydrolase family protein [Sulfitobacter sp. F26204]